MWSQGTPSARSEPPWQVEGSGPTPPSSPAGGRPPPEPRTSSYVKPWEGGCNFFSPAVHADVKMRFYGALLPILFPKTPKFLEGLWDKVFPLTADPTQGDRSTRNPTGRFWTSWVQSASVQIFKRRLILMHVFSCSVDSWILDSWRFTKGIKSKAAHAITKRRFSGAGSLRGTPTASLSRR